jgi:hypothetical protein
VALRRGGPGRGDLRRVPAQGRQQSLLIIDAALLLKAEVLDQDERPAWSERVSIFRQLRSGSTQ